MLVEQTTQLSGTNHALKWHKPYFKKAQIDKSCYKLAQITQLSGTNHAK